MHFWRTISSIGLSKTKDHSELRKVILLNQFSSVAATVYLFSFINNFFIVGDKPSGLFLLLLTLIILFVLLLNKMGKHKIAIWHLLIVVIFSIFYFDSYSGFNSGSYLYYFPSTFAIAFLFDFKTEVKKIIYLTCLIIITVIINLLTQHSIFESSYLTDEMRRSMFYFNLPASLISISYFIYLSIQNNKIQNKILEEKLIEKQKSEIAINKSLKEKELLLSELHHRVKNNLSIISSILNFGIQNNSDSKTALIESKNRVQSMALIHNLLYRNPDLSSISFSIYIDALVQEIDSSYPIKNAKKIIIEKIITDVELDINKAIPCGLLINELLTNAYKHAFTINSVNPTITIKFSNESLSYYLEIKDNGVGLPENYISKKTSGMEIIESLCDQLEAKYNFTSKGGVSFKAWFN